MTLAGFIAVGVGAALGAWLRWWLGVVLNPLFPTLSYGTLAANLTGGYLFGVAVAYSAMTGLPPAMRLFAITGFLGGLTTFSTFSAEVVSLVARAQYAWALPAALAHLFGSLFATSLGIVTVNRLRRVWV